MKIYMLAEHDELASMAEPISAAITTWLEENPNNNLSLVAPSDDECQVGLNLETSKKMALKEPVNFLYFLAKQHKAEFVVGMESEAGERENVCFFGFEEGRPDINEIAHYLGLKR